MSAWLTAGAGAARRHRSCGLLATVQRTNDYAATGRDPDFHKGDAPVDRFNGDPAHRPNPCWAKSANRPSSRCASCRPTRFEFGAADRCRWPGAGPRWPCRRRTLCLRQRCRVRDAGHPSGPGNDTGAGLRLCLAGRAVCGASCCIGACASDRGETVMEPNVSPRAPRAASRTCGSSSSRASDRGPSPACCCRTWAPTW